MPQASGLLIKHLVAPDSGSEDKAYGVDWNRLDDLLRGALAEKVEHLGQLRINGDTVVINSSRNLVGLNAVAQDLDPDGPATRDMGDTTNYWDDAYIQDIYTSVLHFGESDFSPIDVALERGAANRLDLVDGDSFNIVLGELRFGNVAVITSGRKIQNIVSIIQTLLPDAGNLYDLGDATSYWKKIYVATVYTDEIEELTLGAGVEIDGVLLQDNEIITDKIWLDKMNQDTYLSRDELVIMGCHCIASGCVATNLSFPAKEGAFSDTDFDCVKDGLIGIDTTLGAEKLYFRAHGEWFFINKSG